MALAAGNIFMSELNNPYKAPGADIAQAEGPEQEPPRFFAVDGRIGRCRFLVYSTLGTSTLGLALGMVAALLEIFSWRPPIGNLLEFTIGFVAFIPLLIMARRRLHDLDRTGWWLLALLLGLFATAAAVFMMLFLLLCPGSKGANRFGPTPAANPRWLSLVAVPLSLAAIGWGIIDVHDTMEAQRNGPPAATVH